MTSSMKRREKDSAVSPVVGVMLMLVVTIIIAAVVAVFASGVVTTTEPAPNVVLDVKVTNESSYGSGHGLIYLTNVNGNDLDTSKLTIKFTNSTGVTASWSNSNPTTHMGVDFGVLHCGQTMKMIDGWYDTSGSAAISDKVGINASDKVNVAVVYDNYVLYQKDLKVTA